ncbi:pantoate kinase [Methanospirillum purgamenti]|uniref:pantoate kinase n=1 Tax=Methanospirillum purgamenti TaxID=2834276 RepID=UPI002A246688|nr:pantoate kinase [Methanospirillum hungatei]MDX8551018.1 pantoate kinase [Methanospirillum hungatei]
MESASVTAFCPGHISGYFLPVIHENPDKSGSIGGGLVLSEGVRVVARQNPISSVKIFKSDKTGLPEQIGDTSPVIMDLLKKMSVHAAIETTCYLPIGSGYGMSAAALLGTAHAVNSLFNLGLSSHDCIKIAHQVEVMHRTGLGDVSACQSGGAVIRKTPGPDGEIRRLMDLRPIYAITLGPIKTSSILTSPSWMDKISKAFPDYIPETVDELFLASREFAEKSGLISEEVRTVLKVCDDNRVLASMTMLGCGVFAIGKTAEAILNMFGEVYRLTLSPGGPRILHGERCS